jgi:hypothetical protein
MNRKKKAMRNFMLVMVVIVIFSMVLSMFR